MAFRWQPGMEITALLSALNSALAEPFALAWSQDSPRFLLVFTVIYAVVIIVAVTDQKNPRPGAEHGSAAWGDVFRLNKFYMDKRGPNLLLTQHFHIGIDGYKHKHNTNILIVGGSGAGKTRTYGVPNVLECACSMVITDPKAEILRKTGNLLKQKGYEVIVFDLINPATSFCYNPFVYVHDDREVLTLIENLIQNTTPPHAQSSDPFWTKSETALLQALMLYLLHEAPPEEQNFSMVMEMIAAAEVHEDDDNYGRVREHFLAKRHLFVCPCHHAFPRYFLLHHRAEHGAAESHVQGRLGIAGRFVRRVPLSRRHRKRNPQICLGTAGERNHLHDQL